MGTRVVERLRESGIEVSSENERLVCDHFRSLPKRYGVAVKDALSEILMHISLLEDSRNRGGQIAHCLRAVVANLPTKDPGNEVTCSSEAARGELKPSAYIPIETPGTTHRIVSATPTGKDSYLESPQRYGTSLSSLGSQDDLTGLAAAKESRTSSNNGIAMQDCYELTVAMGSSPASLGTVYGTIATTGLLVAETHGFTTQDGYHLYWFVLQDQGRVTSQHLTALDNLFHARFSLDSRGLFPVDAASAGKGAPAPSGGPGGKASAARGAGGAQRRASDSSDEGPEAVAAAAASAAQKGHGGMRRGSSFLNLWKAKLDVQQTSVADWEVDPDKLLLSKKVGQGGFGAIHKGTFNGDVVAIKYIKSDFNKEFEYIKEFAQEISIISELKHENIVEFIGACTKGERVCIIYEFMGNGNLKSFLQKHPKLPTQEKLKMALDICKGMVFLASKSIVHRDLKAANVLMSESGVLKIGDFGVARLLPRNDEVMTAETGTYRWMAPEVIEHKPYNSKADVYSFGVLLWEIMADGKSPYELLSPIQAAIGVAKHGVRPKIPQSCCSQMARLMEQCWESDPDKRPTFEEIQRSLEDAMENVSKSEAAKVVGKGNGTSSPKNSFTGLLSRILK
ncbi:serine/threonine-protein kinase [Chloropicon primus]|nr:serine/threonine-protein kinase [Chloropicon primus]